MTDTDLAPASAADLFLSSLKRPIRLLVAISGGSDSTGLLLALARAIRDRDYNDISLCAATVDHALRAESAAEALEVAALCTRYAIPHVIRRWDGEKPATGLAAAAREARYRLLAQAADELDADAIVTAHTRDDQDETVAMRAARNSDDTALGLAGMADATLYGGSIWILRPFLACRRAAIRADIIEQGESWIDDPSNLDTHYERVRTRLELAGASGSAQISAAAAERRRRLSTGAARLLASHAQLHEHAVLHLAPAALSSETEELRYALAGLLAVMGGGSHRPGGLVMDKVTAFAAAGNGRMTAAHCLLQLRREGLFIARENRAILPLALKPGETGIWDGRFLVANQGLETVTVEAAGRAGNTQEQPRQPLPVSLFRHAMGIQPNTEWASVEVTPALPHFDRFLPEYDLAFANAVAMLVGRPPYALPPHAPC